MRKRTVIAGTAVVGGVLGAALLVFGPSLFRERLTERATRIVSRSIGTEVHVDHASVSLLRSFPRLDVRLDGLTVAGSPPFDNDTFMSVENVFLTFDLIDVIRGQYTARGLILVAPRIDAVSGPDGRTNFAFEPAERPSGSPDDEGIAVQLDLVQIDGMELTWTDEAAGLMIGVQDVDLIGNGMVAPDAITFQTATQVADLSVLSEGATWVHQVRVAADGQVVYGLADGRIDLNGFHGSVNALPVELTATVVPRPDEIEVHASLDAPDATLQGLISLVPAAWRGQLADMTVAGDVVLAGTMDGVLASAEDRWPAFRMTAAVTDGSYKHASLPETVRDLGLDLVIRHAQGPLAAVDIEVNAAGFAVGTSSFEATGAVAQALGEPTIDFDIAADLDLVTLTKAVPVEGFSGRGRIQADVRAQGPLDAFTEPRAEELQVSGTASARDLRIDTALMPLPVDVASADVTFDPRTARVTGLAASFGESDVRGSASFDNLIGYMLGGSILVGNVDLVSDRLDLAPFMETPSSDPAAPGVVQLPRDLDLRGTFAGTEVRFDDWALTDVSGAVHADRGVLRVDGLELGVAGGRVRATGDYQALTADRADLSMDLAVSDLEAPAVLAQFTSVGDLFPAGLVPRGRFGGVVRLDGSLDGEMALIPASVRSNGSLQARGVVLEPGILQQAAQRLGRPEIRELRLGSGALGFVVDAGVLKFDPTAVRLGGFAATLDGSVGLVDRALRVTFATEIPTQGIADSELLGRFGSLVPKQVPVGLTLAGTTTAPSLSIELSEVQGLVKQAVKDQVDALRDRAEVAVDEARAAAIARAQDEAAKLLQQAERAAAKLRTAADRQGDALVAEADGNPLLKAAAKRASDKLIAEADRKAKELIQDARAQGNRGIEAAERVSL